MIRFLALVVELALCGAAMAGPRIVFQQFRVEPASLRLGDSFAIHAQAAATGVKLGSFVLRTADGVKQDQRIPGLALYSHGKYYLAHAGSFALADNGPLDRDPAPGSFRVELSTRDWAPGRYRLAFFASCRPNPGPFVAARRDLEVVVEGDRVRVEDLGASETVPVLAIEDFAVEPAEVQPGQAVKIRFRTAPLGAGSVRLSDSLFVTAAETLPGFTYDADKKKSSRTLPLAGGTFDVPLSTQGWPPGVRLFRLEVLTPALKPADWRDFAVKVVGPNDRLQVTVEDSWFFAPGTHFGRFLKLRDGTILCEDRLSRDGGRSWQSGTGGFGVGGEQLRDGRVLGLDYSCLPIEGRPGWYADARFTSEDAGRHFVRTEARFHVPDAKAAMGHALHRGPLFMRSIVERDDRSLVALMAGWFTSDNDPCPYGRGRPYSRSYVCESTDGGVTWRYLSTIGYERLGSEGYNEGSMRRLPSGEILAVLRTGSERDVNCQDNPIMFSTSRDMGRTWSKPQRTGVEGAYPSLALLADGWVVMSYGRPGAMLVFSADGGRTWTDPTCVDPTPYSGYTDVVELGPGQLLVGFGASDYRDPNTGHREKQLRLARVRYQPRAPAGR